MKAAFVLVLAFIAINTTKAQDSVMMKLVALQNDFVSKIKAAGFTPRLQQPPIIMDNPPSFGQYNDDDNTLHTGDWKTLPDPVKNYFISLAQSRHNGVTGQQAFELGSHQWIFIHEMGHWWRKCQNQSTTPYEEEKAANRIAIAYWRERDPVFFNTVLKLYEDIIANEPSPVPAGESKEKYFNENYLKLPGGAAYSWYQSMMIVEASKETPVPTFKQIIARAGNADIR